MPQAKEAYDGRFQPAIDGEDCRPSDPSDADTLWLLGAGLVMAALAATAGLTDFLGEPRVRALRAAWHHMIGNIVAVLAEIVNLWQRLEQGDAFVVPTGLVVSAGVTLLLLYNGWRGWEMVYRGRVGVAD
ncbi:DUF2231 domain-containing protein [Sphingomonas sp. UNC305MFCol5.2]|uniref:DUF2231 domain-containing protein n=1 Tax=Sphingomonas sp. UNC305MFCol5.2 TaxID=1449076 RepID=UPI00046ED91E|nr:DUF2231 domain-containing protein [Sphingomonas sp. UNC305MFCol5.2]